ncbi:MAG TPA: hypothetical protein VGO09_06440 [Flavisolibacter sp.]|nr:hypothetical protein [Flavisolibacter sp.]
MNANYFISIIFFFAIPLYSLAQRDTSFKLIKTYNGDIADAVIDNLDDIYIISSAGQIKKFTPSGDSVFYNQVKKYGRLYTLDVTNPLKLLLFYKDYSTIVILDRYLSSITSIDLPKNSILQPSAIGLSYDNNIWVFDEYDSKLKKIDMQGNKLLETSDFRSIFNHTISPQKIINDNGFVYLADTANGVLVFDNYGSFKKKILVKNWQSIAINSNYVISTNNETVSFYNTTTFLQTDRRMPFFKPYIHSYTSANKLITFSSDTLNVYLHRY